MDGLPRAVEILAAGSWPADTAADHVVLAYEERHRRRLRYVAQQGTTFLLDLPRAVLLRDGDGLRLTDGRIIAVEAAPERLIRIAAPEETLIRMAWHLGNRHLPVQLSRPHILIRDDPVILAMLRGLGDARFDPVLAPFTPEVGAYQSSVGHPHEHEDL